MIVRAMSYKLTSTLDMNTMLQVWCGPCVPMSCNHAVRSPTRSAFSRIAQTRVRRSYKSIAWQGGLRQSCR